MAATVPAKFHRPWAA